MPERYDRASATTANGELHVCGHQINNTIRHSSRVNRPFGQSEDINDMRSWEDLEAVAGALRAGRPREVACAGVDHTTPDEGSQDLHAVVVTDDGHLWHTVATGWTGEGRATHFTTWSAFGDVASVAPGAPPEGFVHADATGLPGGGLAVVAISRGTKGDGSDRHLLMTIRTPAGHWAAFRDLIAGQPTDTPGAAPQLRLLSIGTCLPGAGEGRWHVAVVVSGGGRETPVSQPHQTRTMFSIVSSNPEDWDRTAVTDPTEIRPWEDVDLVAKAASGQVAPGGTSAVTVAERPINP